MFVVPDEAELNREVAERRRTLFLTGFVVNQRVFVTNSDLVHFLVKRIGDEEHGIVGVLNFVRDALDELGHGEKDRVKQFHHFDSKTKPLVNAFASVRRNVDEEVPLLELEEVSGQGTAKCANEARKEADDIFIEAN